MCLELIWTRNWTVIKTVNDLGFAPTYVYEVPPGTTSVEDFLTFAEPSGLSLPHFGRNSAFLPTYRGRKALWFNCWLFSVYYLVHGLMREMTTSVYESLSWSQAFLQSPYQQVISDARSIIGETPNVNLASADLSMTLPRLLLRSWL